MHTYLHLLVLHEFKATQRQPKRFTSRCGSRNTIFGWRFLQTSAASLEERMKAATFATNSCKPNMELFQPSTLRTRRRAHFLFYSFTVKCILLFKHDLYMLILYLQFCWTHWIIMDNMKTIFSKWDILNTKMGHPEY